MKKKAGAVNVLFFKNKIKEYSNKLNYLLLI